MKKKDELYDRRGMPTQIEDAVFTSGLTIYQKMVYMTLCFYARMGSAFPSYKTIAENSGCSERKTITVIQELVELKLIKKRTRKRRRTNYTNVYEIFPMSELEPIRYAHGAPPPYKKQPQEQANTSVDHVDYAHGAPQKNDEKTPKKQPQEQANTSVDHVDYAHGAPGGAHGAPDLKDLKDIVTKDKEVLSVSQSVPNSHPVGRDSEERELDALNGVIRSLNLDDEFSPSWVRSIVNTLEYMCFEGVSGYPRRLVRSKLHSINGVMLGNAVEKFNKYWDRVQNKTAYFAKIIFSCIQEE